MKKKWFYRMLLSYAPILLFLVLALSLFFYVKWNAETKVRIQNTNGLFTSHVASVLDSSMKTIEKSVIQMMLTDELIEDYLNSTQPTPPYTIMEISNRLADLRTMFPITGDVYIYKSSTGEVITTSALFKLDGSFQDEDFLREAIRHADPGRWTSPRQFRQFASDASQEVVSLVKRVPITSTTGKGVVVVNIKLGAIQSLMKAVNADTSSYMQLTGGDGALMYRTNEPPLAEWGVSRVESSYSGWRLTVGVPQSEERFMTVFLDGWTLPTLVTMLLSILVLTYVTHRNYKPIERIMMQIGQYTLKRSLQVGKGGNHNEFQFISIALDNLIEKTNEYEAKHQDDLLIRKRYWFYELVDGNFSLTASEWEHEAGELELPDSFRSTLVAVTVLDNHEQFLRAYNTRDRSLLKFVVQGVWNEICGNHGMTVWSEWKDADQLISILYTGQDRDPALVLHIANELRSWVAEHLQFTVSVYLGSTAEESDDIHSSYRAALQAGQYRNLHGYNKVYPATEWRLAAKGDLYVHLTTARQLVKLLRAADPAWTDLFQRLFREMRQDELLRDQCAEVVAYVFYSLEKEMSELPETLLAEWMEIFRRHPPAAILAKELNREMENSLLLFLQAMFDALREWRHAEPKMTAVEQITQYVNSHYADPDLSLDLIGDTFGLAPRLVSKLFKAGTGIRFIDYVLELRMKEAERLLKETNLSVQNIGMQVGYPQVISFIRTFKRYSGQTPGEYRKMS
ncbi:helix-turn-helix transcriptional regulator [Paenibacillus antri]|uniref:Helix-turn-helix transcriptional regulator n=1 Tax=Paenibacillus antri TaxID=2582848 RepID=A0A5R9G8U8_9BACL|nr:AraC family transcriptional regulator [Paenibacillus antri]TLS52151.1 helix-turn-helix transcriptional regulator [Paenibacillus antri]